jgi:hypothetical protein
MPLIRFSEGVRRRTLSEAGAVIRRRDEVSRKKKGSIPVKKIES